MTSTEEVMSRHKKTSTVAVLTKATRKENISRCCSDVTEKAGRKNVSVLSGCPPPLSAIYAVTTKQQQQQQQQAQPSPAPVALFTSTRTCSRRHTKHSAHEQASTRLFIVSYAVISVHLISSSNLISSHTSLTTKAMVLSKDGTLSQSLCSSTMAPGDRMSGRIDSACPSLM